MAAAETAQVFELLTTHANFSEVTSAADIL